MSLEELLITRGYVLADMRKVSLNDATAGRTLGFNLFPLILELLFELGD